MPNNYARGIFPDVIKFRVAVHTISQKAIRFRHLDYDPPPDPDRDQNLFSSSMSRHLSAHKMSFTFSQSNIPPGTISLPVPTQDVSHGVKAKV